MSVRSKILLLALAVSAACVIITVIVQETVILPEFEGIELRISRSDVVRCRAAINRELDGLAGSAADYGGWDDTYRYIEDHNAAFETTNLTQDSFKNLRLNFLAIFPTDGPPIWVSMRTSEGEPRDCADLIAQLARPDHPLRIHPTTDSRQSGIIRCSVGPLLVSSAVITTSDRSGAPRGCILMGRLLNDALIRDIAQQTCVAFTLGPASEDVQQHDQVAGAINSDAQDPETLRSQTILNDVEGKPALLLTTELPRTILRGARTVAATALASSLLYSIVLMVVLALGLMRVVVNPLTRVTAHALRVGANDDLRAKLNETRSDELGILAREIDRMVDRLADSRGQLLDIAHRSGKAQIAIDVLHNIGNVLNRVTVATDVLSQRLRTSEVNAVAQAAKLMQSHAQDIGTFMSSDDRGRRLPAFLDKLAAHLASEQQDMLTEVSALNQAVEHIRAVLQRQQAVTSGRPLMEWMRPRKLIEESLSLSCDSLTRHGVNVNVECDVEQEVELDKHRVMQVLVNLISNAKHSLNSRPSGSRELVVSAAIARDADNEWLQLAVTDNGVGVAPGDIERLFRMGYSTRPDGQGIGLHSSANLAIEMGGSLFADSEGLGKGARFTLRIPLKAREVTV